MSAMTMNIMGFPAVNRDLTVELREPVSQRLIKEVRPFLDGTVKVPRIEPGPYEITLRHPNLTLPVLRRPIRVLPHGETKVSVLIDPSKFRNTPIEDIPEANLGPVTDIAESISASVAPLAEKQPGEAILAGDWNQMAASIRDLADAVGELTRVISPVGHDHPEFVAKFDEMSTNFETLLETLSSSLTELQRQIHAQRLKEQVEEVLDRADIDRESTRGREFLDLVERVNEKVTDSPTNYGREVRNAAVQLESKMDQLLQEKQDDEQFTKSVEVEKLSIAVERGKKQRTRSYKAELDHHRTSSRHFADASKLKFGG
jgi:hypothetical protein